MGVGSDPARHTVPILIALLCGAALILIALILSGSEFDKTSAKALGTACTFALFYLTAVAGTALSRRRPELSLLGHLTVAFSLAAFLAVNAAIWSGDLFSNRWRVAGDTIVLAIAAANVSLMLRSAPEKDSEAVRLARGGAIAALTALSLMVIFEVSSSGQDIGPQPLAVAAVLYLLGVALIPLLRRLSPPQFDDAEAALPEPGRQPTAEPGAARHPADESRVLRLDHTVIAVTDPDRSNAFYRDVIGAELISAPDGRIAYRIGGQQLNVHWAGTQAAPLAAAPVVPGNSDLCFIWNGPIDTAIAHLQRHGIEIVHGPDSRLGAQGPGRSVHFRDPDGSLIELISYQ
jgi:catechol 2,3-dioxygenase-like lactoylglutathione lyase family enzyme